MVPVLIFLVVCATLFFRIYNLTEKRHREYGNIKRIFGVSMYLIDTVLVIPLFGVIFRLTLCDNDGSNNSLADCNSTSYFMTLFLALVLIVGLFGLELCVGMFFFNFDFKLKDNLSRSYNIMHLVFRLYCTLVVGLDVYMKNDSLKFTTIYFLQFIFASIFCIDYYNRLPYYNRSVSEYYCYSTFGYFWVTLVLLTTYLADYQLITNNMVYIVLIGLGFFLYLVRTYREYFYRRLLIKEIDEIDNEIHLDARFRYLLQIVVNSQKNKQDELLLTSIIKVHTEKCIDPKCVCKNRDELFDPKTKSNYRPDIPIFKNMVFIKNYLLKLIKESCNKLPKSSLLHIDLFLFLYKEMMNISQVNHHILLFEKQAQQSLFVTVKYAIYRLKISIYYSLKQINKEQKFGEIRYENIRIFDEEMKTLTKYCLKIIEFYARMWDILNDPLPDAVLLEKVCTKLIDERHMAEISYVKILGVTNNSINFLVLMTLYSKFIVFDELLFIEVIERLRKLTATPNLDDTINVNHVEFKKQFTTRVGGKQLINMDGPFCSIAISFNMENLGQIVWSSESCQNIFDYESNYLRTFNIAHIIPSVIAKHHNRFLTEYFETGKEVIITALSHVWALNKSKNLFSILLIMKMFISREGLTFVSLIRKLNESDYMLITKKGKVDSFGTKFRDILHGFPKDFFERNSYLNLMSLAPKMIGLFLPEIYGWPEFTFSVDKVKIDTCISQ